MNKDMLIIPLLSCIEMTPNSELKKVYLLYVISIIEKVVQRTTVSRTNDTRYTFVQRVKWVPVRKPSFRYAFSHTCDKLATHASKL